METFRPMNGKLLTVYAPASSGNVSVGFDALGLALAPVDGSLAGRLRKHHTRVVRMTGHCVLTGLSHMHCRRIRNRTSSLHRAGALSRQLALQARNPPVEYHPGQTFAGRQWPGLKCQFNRRDPGCTEPIFWPSAGPPCTLTTDGRDGRQHQR